MASSDVVKMTITVRDPAKHNEGMNAYVTYKVTIVTDAEGYENKHVHRRYSDFCWLQSELAAEFPGLVIPPLPEKHMVRRFSEQFLAQRQRSLEKFLVRIAGHSTLRSSRYVKAFLQSDSLEHFKGVTSRKPKKEMSLWNWATAATASLSSRVAGGPVNRPKTEDDLRFDEVKQYINSLEPQLVAVHKHTHGLVEKGREMAQALFDFGLAFTLLGQAEAGALGDAMSKLGHCADNLSRTTADEADKEMEFFDEPIQDYVRLAKQVKLALDVRTDKMNTYESLLSEQESKKAACDRLNVAGAGDAPNHSQKVAAADEELRAVSAQVEKAKEECDVVTRRVFEEIERFKCEKLVDFKAIVQDYVQMQIEYNKRVEDAWREVLPTLQGLISPQTDDAGSPNAQPHGPDTAGFASPTAAQTLTSASAESFGLAEGAVPPAAPRMGSLDAVSDAEGDGAANPTPASESEEENFV